MRELRNTKIIAVDHGYGNICATAKGYESLGLYEPEKEEINHAEPYPQHEPAI
ncbi:hypothetical protein [Ruminococcus sp. 5_1_39BFAA]|uniref:hypothetical protein n=1 Tax=Ruminococcus sp. 5_1_39BFAA TaxID=457412 RepID=UPI00356440B0